MDLVHRRALETHRGHILTAKGDLPTPTVELLARITGGSDLSAPVWAEALTHGSFSVSAGQNDYQRLEFLGDRVLGLVIAEWLHAASDGNEGALSQRLNALVSRQTCATVARANGLGPHVRLGKQARDDGAADSENVLGDVMEALIGAQFLTHGFAATREMVRTLWADVFAGRAGKAKHPKSALQEWAAGNRKKVPEYRLVSREGPDHASRFTVAVAVKGVGEAEASGTSKQEAETSAAAEFLRLYG